MTQKTVEAVLRKATSETEFRARLTTDPDAALVPYRDQLTDQEVNEIRSVSVGVLNSLSRINEFRSPQRWYQPSSFKELGGAILSMVVLGVLVFVAAQAFSEVATSPRAEQFGDQLHIVDPFERSKDLLNLFFPLFSAVVTFWLGVAVEGRRADKNEAQANEARESEKKARQDQMEAEAETAGTRATAKASLAHVKAVAMSASRSTVQGSRPEVTFESGGLESATQESATPGLDPIANILVAVEAAERQLE